jgi:hypothetical protein
MPPERLLWCHVLAVATGLVTFFDSKMFVDIARYFSVGLPVCYLVAGLLGYLGPVHSWRWSLEMIGTHLVGTILFSSGARYLWPLPLVVALVLALPGILTAWLGAVVYRFWAAMQQADR